MAAPKARKILEMNAFDFERDAGKGSQSALLARRRANFGAASVLFYERPIEMVAAEGAWMTDAEGNRYLDFYNNVPSVGHTHPRVVEAVTRQIGTLNTNSRYLSRVTETYLETLKATFPEPTFNVSLCCTGSEANDLAMRVAMMATGQQGFIVTEMAYHGNTLLSTNASPSAFKIGAAPDTIATVPAPGPLAYGDDIGGGFAAAVREATATLDARGHGIAGFLCDSIFSSDGVFADPPGFLGAAVDAVHEAGGLYIADEVQPGFGRTGSHLWGFSRHAVAPDIITMGKPMGNGFPMAGMAARPELVAAFTAHFGYFNTFGGNPVAAAAGQAVLDVIEDEGLVANAGTVGAHLRDQLDAVAKADPRVAAIRGAGLFLGVDLTTDGDPQNPDPALASRVINGLRDEGVLIGAAGKYGHTLKVRPPLCLTKDEADIFAERFAKVLARS